uniref:Uncharacterized protein n=1 Tax=Cannabis sativa TaxID=3483 RepID=A0A803PXI8_CANSA
MNQRVNAKTIMTPAKAEREVRGVTPKNSGHVTGINSGSLAGWVDLLLPPFDRTMALRMRSVVRVFVLSKIVSHTVKNAVDGWPHGLRTFADVAHTVKNSVDGWPHGLRTSAGVAHTMKKVVVGWLHGQRSFACVTQTVKNASVGWPH